MAKACNAYSNLGANAIDAPPRTIISAVSGVRSLHDRLDDVISQLSSLSDTIGGPRVCGASESKNPAPMPGVLNGLHDAVDRANSRISTIAELVATIARQLG